MKQPPKKFRDNDTNHQTETPAETWRQQNLAVGSILESEPIGEPIIFQGPRDAPALAARGLLRDYFASREDVQRFLEEERHAREDEKNDH